MKQKQKSWVWICQNREFTLSHLHKVFFAACDSQITIAFWKLMNQPISLALYQIEILEDLRKEQQKESNREHKKDGFENNNFTKYEG